MSNNHLEQVCAVPDCTNRAGDTDDSLYRRIVAGKNVEVCGPCMVDIDAEVLGGDDRVLAVTGVLRDRLIACGVDIFTEDAAKILTKLRDDITEILGSEEFNQTD